MGGAFVAARRGRRRLSECLWVAAHCCEAVAAGPTGRAVGSSPPPLLLPSLQPGSKQEGAPTRPAFACTKSHPPQIRAGRAVELLPARSSRVPGARALPNGAQTGCPPVPNRAHARARCKSNCCPGKATRWEQRASDLQPESDSPPQFHNEQPILTLTVI